MSLKTFFLYLKIPLSTLTKTLLGRPYYPISNLGRARSLQSSGAAALTMRLSGPRTSNAHPVVSFHLINKQNKDFRKGGNLITQHCDGTRVYSEDGAGSAR